MATHVLHVDAIECASDVILGLARHDVPEHTSVVAAREWSARGGWDAPLGGLWLTTLWRPRLDARRAALLPLAASWAVSEAVERHAGITTELAWPGDVLVSGRTAGAAAVEGRVEGRRVLAAAVAIGLHVNNDAGPGGTSLARELGHDLDLAPLVDEVAARLREARGLLDRPVALIEGFSSRWADRRRPLLVDVGHEMVEGTASRIDVDGALVLERHGVERRIDDPALAGFVQVVG